jgi:hypothetical protein
MQSSYSQKEGVLSAGSFLLRTHNGQQILKHTASLVTTMSTYYIFKAPQLSNSAQYRPWLRLALYLTPRGLPENKTSVKTLVSSGLPLEQPLDFSLLQLQ